MRAVLLLCVLLAGCGADTEPEPTVDTPPAAPPPAPAPGLTAEQLTGTWDMRVTTEAGEEIPGFRLFATADPAGWTMQFDGRDPMPVRATVAGDSVVHEFGPYESILRPEVTVTTTVVSRLVDGRLEGPLVARYANAGADSVMRARAVGTRAAVQ